MAVDVSPAPEQADNTVKKMKNRRFGNSVIQGTDGYLCAITAKISKQYFPSGISSKPMKKLVFLFLMLPAFVFAQETGGRRVRFGLKIAPMGSWMKPDFDTQGASSQYQAEGGGLRFGFSWGPTVEFRLDDNFLIGTGVDINYFNSRLNGRSTLSGGPVPIVYDWENTYKARYVEIPLMIKGRTKEIGALRYFLNFGLSAGFRYKSSAEFSDVIGNQSNVSTFNDASSFMNSFRGALLVGGGVEYNLSGNTSLVAGIQFNNGLTNQLKNQIKFIRPEYVAAGYNADDIDKVKESAILNYLQLNVGILF